MPGGGRSSIRTPEVRPDPLPGEGNLVAPLLPASAGGSAEFPPYFRKFSRFIRAMKRGSDRSGS